MAVGGLVWMYEMVVLVGKDEVAVLVGRDEVVVLVRRCWAAGVLVVVVLGVVEIHVEEVVGDVVCESVVDSPAGTSAKQSVGVPLDGQHQTADDELVEPVLQN